MFAKWNLLCAEGNWKVTSVPCSFWSDKIGEGEYLKFYSYFILDFPNHFLICMQSYCMMGLFPLTLHIVTFMLGLILAVEQVTVLPGCYHNTHTRYHRHTGTQVSLALQLGENSFTSPGSIGWWKTNGTINCLKFNRPTWRITSRSKQPFRWIQLLTTMFKVYIICVFFF